MTPVKLQSIKFANAVKVGPHIESEYIHAKTHDVDITMHNFWIRLDCKRSKESSWTTLFNTINCSPEDPTIILGATNETQGNQGKKAPSKSSKGQSEANQAAASL